MPAVSHGLSQLRKLSSPDSRQQQGSTHYWFEFMLFAGILFINGAAPPESKKFTDAGLLFTFVDFRHPLKYGSSITLSPFTVAGARIPGTETPTLGIV